MKESVVIYNWPENCLVPENYFHIDFAGELLKLMHGDLNRGTLYSERISSWELYNIFRIPLELHNLLQHRLPAGKYRHYDSLWLECQRNSGKALHDRVMVIFHPNEILITVIADSCLQLVQRLEYQTAEDVGYHLLNVFSRFNISQQETPLKISGMIDLNSAMYEELLKYFQLIETEPVTSGLLATSDLQSYPEHFFSPILNMALCVS